MSNLATHLRITGLQVTDDDVDRRTKAVSELATAYGKITGVKEILEKAAEIAIACGGDGTPPPSLGAEVQTAVQVHASSFLSSEKPLEVGVCSGFAALSAISPAPIPSQMGVWTVPDVLAAGLWSALSFQAPLKDPKRETFRSELLAGARSRVIRAAETTRKRSEVPDFTEFSVAADGFDKVPAAFKEATAATIEALRRNAALDREELDFLWWAMLDRSRLLNKRLADLDEPLRLVVAGIEAASNLRRLPCDVHSELVLRSVTADGKVNLADLLTAIGDSRRSLISKFPGDVITQIRPVFPLLSSLVTEDADIDGAPVKRSASEWGTRALLEAALYHLRFNVSKL